MFLYVSKTLFNLNSKRNEKFELFSQGTDDFQNTGNETLLIINHENVKKSAFDWLTAKLCSKKAVFSGIFAPLSK